MLHRGTLLFWLLTAGASPCLAAEPVTVVLQSGQRLTGLVDSQTDAERLWLRFERGSAVMRRPFPWSQLSQAFVGRESLTPAVLRQRSGELSSTAPKRAKPARPRTAQATAERQTANERPANAAPPPGQPTMLRIEAAAGNWDTDNEADGLLLTAIVEDARGEQVPASGTLTVELIGQPLSPGGRMGPGGVTRLQSYPTLANWVRQVVPDEAGADGYTFRLEFQALDPDFNLQVGVSAMVHARLFVPGVGALDASTSTIGLRQFNPLRDQWQQQQQGRFFPQEQTGRSKQLP